MLVYLGHMSLSTSDSNNDKEYFSYSAAILECHEASTGHAI